MRTFLGVIFLLAFALSWLPFFDLRPSPSRSTNPIDKIRSATLDDVLNWLKRQGATPKDLEAFRREEIDGTNLLLLTDADLEDMVHIGLSRDMKQYVLTTLHAHRKLHALQDLLFPPEAPAPSPSRSMRHMLQDLLPWFRKVYFALILLSLSATVLGCGLYVLGVSVEKRGDVSSRLTVAMTILSVSVPVLLFSMLLYSYGNRVWLLVGAFLAFWSMWWEFMAPQDWSLPKQH
eukprot:TRINITY_DN401_c0_g1_i1.p1 TRINITY_DN401_c0_g1~~TRINITY_DN401_c0_g1_i1.p1  ORF type:complete len:233 (+),score=55.01 TRINITY_DN401_c0_g1_i1:100-798(+)